MIDYNDHPGSTSKYQCEQLAKVARIIPDFSNIVEIGAYYGRTSRVYYYNKQKNSKLTVIDDFWYEDSDNKILGNKELIENAITQSKKFETTYYSFLDLCKDFVDDITVLHQKAENYEIKTPFDFVYLDAAHDNRKIKIIDKFITDNNIMSGHDFIDEHPIVIKNVLEAKNKYKRELVLIKDTSIWFLLNKNSFFFDSLYKENIEINRIS